MHLKVTFNMEFGLKGLIRSREKPELNFCWIHPSCVTLGVVSRLGTWSHHCHTELTQEGEINAPINAERSGTRSTWYCSTFLLVTQTVGSRHPQQWIILNQSFTDDTDLWRAVRLEGRDGSRGAWTEKPWEKNLGWWLMKTSPWDARNCELFFFSLLSFHSFLEMPLLQCCGQSKGKRFISLWANWLKTPVT